MLIIPLIITQIEDDDDRRFMTNLYKDQYNIWRKTAYRYTQNPHAIEDILQDACTRLVDKISILRRLDLCALHTYCVSTIRRVSLNHLRRLGTASQHIYYGANDDAYHQIAEKAEDSDATPDVTVDQIDIANDLKHVMPLLAESDRDILIFKYFEELENHEIAKTMEISTNNVRAKLSNARKNARTLLLSIRAGEKR